MSDPPSPSSSTAHSHIHTEDTAATKENPRPSLTSHPPIFVLSTHLSLEELHDVEESLIRRGASLTYDISEARLVLGKIGQKKRAALELRFHGLWTEEVRSVDGSEFNEPPRKRARVEEGLSEESAARHAQHTAGRDVIDLTTEKAEGERERRSPSPDGGLSAASGPSVASTLSSDGAIDVIKVVKLEWLDKSIEAGRALTLDPFILYEARIVERPPDLIEPPRDESKTNAPEIASQIVQRAKADAALHPPPIVPSSRSLGGRRQHPDATHGHREPPKLLRQSTSENDDAVPTPPAPDWVRDKIRFACMRSAPPHPPNEKFIHQLQKVRRVRELTLDEIGVRAYSTSISAIAAYPYEFRKTTEVLSLPGCDTKIANLFAEFKNSTDGTLSTANILDTDPVLRILDGFYNIWGVGAKTARDFYYFRHWRDLDDIVEHGWNTLSRVQQIGVKYYDELKLPIPRPETEDIAQTVQRHANLVRPHAAHDGRDGVECVIVGGYRRGKEVSGDVDLVLSHRDESVTGNLVVDIVGSLESEGWVSHTLALHMTNTNREQQPLPFRSDDSGKHFDTLDKALLIWQDPRVSAHETGTAPKNDNEGSPDGSRHHNPNPHRRVDIIISPWRTVGCAVLGWTGETTFERDLRRYTRKAHGWKFDSSGIRERTSPGRVVDLEAGGRTWEERERFVMEGLGIGYRDACLRCSR